MESEIIHIYNGTSTGLNIGPLYLSGGIALSREPNLLVKKESFFQNPDLDSQTVAIVPPRFKLSLSSFSRRLAGVIAGIGLVILLVFYLPSLAFWVSSSGKTIFFPLKEEKGTGTVSAPQPVLAAEEIYQPRLDKTLPLENKLTIPALGIETKINEAPAEDYEEALKIGVWRADDSGTPFDRRSPTILAAHRYGYLKWSVPYRLKNSFYNLPKLKVGETVEIVWRQRRYLYEVYAEGKGEEITDYSADLILYTCESLNSPVRIFKYARLLKV